MPRLEQARAAMLALGLLGGTHGGHRASFQGSVASEGPMPRPRIEYPCVCPNNPLWQVHSGPRC
jgi:hypothetical protein